MPLALYKSSQSGMTGIHTVTGKTTFCFVQANDRKQKDQTFEKNIKCSKKKQLRLENKTFIGNSGISDQI